MADSATVQQWMEVALAEARRAAWRGEVPVGAVLVQAERIVVQAGNQIEARNDATAHAELLVLQQAATVLGKRRLDDCELIVTLEPCPMCAMALVLARIRAVHFAARDPKFGGVVSVAKLFTAGLFNHQVQWTEGVCALESRELMRRFFASLRHEKRLLKT